MVSGDSLTTNKVQGNSRVTHGRPDLSLLDTAGTQDQYDVGKRLNRRRDSL